MLERSNPREVQLQAFRTDVLEGLSRQPKTLPSRWLYDDRGSELFEEITGLEEYYPTRTETGILRSHAGAIADFCGRRAVLVEYGAGAGLKTEIVLAALQEPLLYVPVDIAGDFLAASARRLERRFPTLQIRPVVADFTQDFVLPSDVPNAGRRRGFFPGSTIGNLDVAETRAFLRRMRRQLRAAGRAVIGVDLRKDVSRLVRAYDDSPGVTAEFNRNILRRINRELGGDFPLDRFVHEARWNEEESAIEMHLKSLDSRTVAVAGRRFGFAAGETIHTESSRKYTVDGFAALAAECGWSVAEVWSDPDRLFAVVGLAADG